MYDHSIRVPFAIAGPTMEAGKTVSAPIYLQDIIPTSLELSGAEVPEHVQFQSFLPILAGKSEGREAIYTGYRMSQRQITDDGFKLIVSPRGQVARLFDHLNADPFEKYDLIEQGKQL